MTDTITLPRAVIQDAIESMRGYARETGDTQPCDAEKALRAALAQPVREPLTDELTSIKEMGKHAFRALDKAASVIATIDPESNDESEELAKLTTEIHDVAMSLFTVCGLPMQEAALWFYRERAHGIGGGE